MSEFRKKNPVIGGVLSALFPGIGQIYNEEYGKGVILIAVAITAGSALVYSVLTAVPMFLSVKQSDLQAIQPGPVTALVSTVLILIALWFYGIIDAITCAQRLSVKPAGNAPEAVAVKHREGAKTLGIILLIAGTIILLFQLGIGWNYLLRYGGPGLLILFGVYLLLQGTGVLKKLRSRR